MNEYWIKKLTEEGYAIELHGEDEVIEFRKICREHDVNTDPLIKKHFCRETKAQDKIYAMQVRIITTTDDIVLFYHESYYDKEPLGNIIRFNSNSINHQNDLISWIK